MNPEQFLWLDAIYPALYAGSYGQTPAPHPKNSTFTRKHIFYYRNASAVVSDMPQADNHAGPWQIFSSSLDLSKSFLIQA